MVANIFNWLFNMQAGRILTKEEFGTLTVFLSFQYIFTVAAGSLTTTVSRFTAYYSEKREQEKHFYFFRQYWWLTWTLGLIFLLFFLAFQGFIKSFFGFDSSTLILLFALLLIPLFLVSFEKGVMLGQLAFVWVGVLFLIESGTKLIFLLISPMWPISTITATVLALPVSIFAAWFVSILIARSFHPFPVVINFESSKDLKDTYKFLGNSVFAGLGAVLIYSLDVLLVKHFFSASEAGIYSTLSLLGKTLYFATGSLIGMLIPLTARAQAKNQSGRAPFLILLGLVTFVGISIWLSYTLIPEFVVTKLLRERGLVALPYLSTYSLGMLFLVLVNCFTVYNLAKKNYLPVRLTLVAAAVEAALIFINHQSLTQVVSIVTLTLFMLLVAMVVIELLGITTEVLLNNVTTFFKLFVSENRFGSHRSGKIKILIFNWRDTKHVYAGGAEVYLQEIGKRLSKDNCEITLFTSNDGRCLASEEHEGVHIIRRGGFITVYFWAILYYILKFRGKFDVILDCENGTPFFTPLFARKPVILLVHHVHQDIFFKSLVPPFSWLANFLETYFMSWLYQKSCVVAVSDSTADDLLKEIGLATTAVISSGVNLSKYRVSEKSPVPLVCYVGRLKKYKSVDVLLLAFKEVLTKSPNAQLVIAGDGDERLALEKKALELGISQSVRFLGWVSEKEKVNLLGRSWVMVQPSFMEGWGITCLEANACGTPVLASRVSGLKDAVSEGVSGYLFEYGDFYDLGRRLQELLDDQAKRVQLGKTARTWSEKYSWIAQSEKFSHLIRKIKELNLPQPTISYTEEIRPKSKYQELTSEVDSGSGLRGRRV